MSGIYIPGLEMPNACDECACGILLDGYLMPFCAITSKDMCRNDFHTKRQDDCPLVPVPPHGRLIEDTAVREQIDEWLDSVGDVVVGHGLSYYGELLGCIEDAPTIIPAEEGECALARLREEVIDED